MDEATPPKMAPNINLHGTMYIVTKLNATKAAAESSYWSIFYVWLPTELDAAESYNDITIRSTTMVNDYYARNEYFIYAN